MGQRFLVSALRLDSQNWQEKNVKFLPQALKRCVIQHYRQHPLLPQENVGIWGLGSFGLRNKSKVNTPLPFKKIWINK